MHGPLYGYLDPRSLVSYPIVPVRKRMCQRCWLPQMKWSAPLKLFNTCSKK
jgi:hypothetical protein